MDGLAGLSDAKSASMHPQVAPAVAFLCVYVCSSLHSTFRRFRSCILFCVFPLLHVSYATVMHLHLTGARFSPISWSMYACMPYWTFVCLCVCVLGFRDHLKCPYASTCAPAIIALVSLFLMDSHRKQRVCSESHSHSPAIVSINPNAGSRRGDES